MSETTEKKPKVAAVKKSVKAEASVEKASAKKVTKSAADVATKTTVKSEKLTPKVKGVNKEITGPAVVVTQIRSPVGREASQRATLIGLGLNKMHRSRVLEDTPSIRGMILKVAHLVKVETRQ